MGSVRVTIEIRNGPLTRRVRVTAPSIERALKISGVGMPGRKVRLLSATDLGARGHRNAA